MWAISSAMPIVVLPPWLPASNNRMRGVRPCLFLQRMKSSCGWFILRNHSLCDSLAATSTLSRVSGLLGSKPARMVAIAESVAEGVDGAGVLVDDRLRFTLHAFLF